MEKRLYMRGYHVDFAHREVNTNKERENKHVLPETEPLVPVKERSMKQGLTQTTPDQWHSPSIPPPVGTPDLPDSPAPNVTDSHSSGIEFKTPQLELRSSGSESGPRTSPTPDDLEIWGIVFIVLGIIIGLLSIPFWEAALTTAYILLGIGGALFMAGLVCLFIYDPEGCIEACGEILVEALMGIILGLLCGGH
ncbi:MAG: hypothetical protein IT233_12480 [Bacteroidia bacterium]|nr:hypothetical protein [Bacteroidia bacterium]